jgi:hypothetical protein
LAMRWVENSGVKVGEFEQVSNLLRLLCNGTLGDLEVIADRIGAGVRRERFREEEVDAAQGFDDPVFGRSFSTNHHCIVRSRITNVDRRTHSGATAVCPDSIASRLSGPARIIGNSSNIRRPMRITDDAANGSANCVTYGRSCPAWEGWPVGRLPAGFGEEVQSAVPVLIMNGENDPATPPDTG